MSRLERGGSIARMFYSEDVLMREEEEEEEVLEKEGVLE